MSAQPYRSGDFVWSAYPEREQPTRPGPRHIGYVTLTTGNAVYLAYTSTRIWAGPEPLGVFRFDRAAATSMGQTRAFILDLRRIAALPTSPSWFPDIDSPSSGIVGRVQEPLRLSLEAAATALFTRRPELIQRLGPLWAR